MDPEIFPSTAQSSRTKDFSQQIGDLHLSLRHKKDFTTLPTSGHDSLRQLIDQNVIGIFRSTADGKLVMANAALAGMFGYKSPEELLESIKNIPSQIYVDPQRRKEFCRLFQKGDTVNHFISKAYRKHREIIWIEEYAREWRDSQGYMMGYEGVVLDITEQHQHALPSLGTVGKLEQAVTTRTAELSHLTESMRQKLEDSQQTVKALSQDLDRYRIAAKASQEGFWEGCPLPDQHWSSPETPAWYSSQFVALLGFEEHEFPPVLETWASLIHPEDRERVFQAMAAHIDHHVPYEVESRLKTKQGEYRWFKAKGHAIFDKEGKLIRGGGTIRDITEQKKSQEALEAIMKGTVSPGSPNFFKTLVQQLAETLGVPMVSLTEHINTSFRGVRMLAFWNRDHFEEGFVYDCEGGPCEKVLEGQTVYIPHGAQNLFPGNETVKSLRIEGYWGIPLLSTTGEVLGNLAIMNQSPLNIQSMDDSLLKVFAARAGTELERKRAQEALQESEERYRALYDQTPLMYFTVDSHLMVLSVNQFGADLLGYGVHELVGMSVRAVVHEEDHTVVQLAVEQSLHGINRMPQIEFRKVKKDGTVLWVRETIQTILDPHQQKILLLSCEDITDRKRAEEALAHSEKQLRHTQKMEAIGTLAGGIAHDFNNILGAILGYSELALTQVSHDQRVKSYLEEVVTAGIRAKELVKQILAFSRRSDQEREAVDLKDIVKEALKMIRATLPATIEIRSSLEVDPAVLFADSTQIHQVVMNLCANAEYAMRKEGGILELVLTSVEITEKSVVEFPSVKPGTYLRLTIQDSGQGISARVLERIFEPFFTTKGSGEGTGLGLAVVHGVIVGHGGHISVSSVKGQGTTFTVLLPRLDVVLPAKTDKTEEWPKGSGRVLFVDDEDVLARWGEQLLTHLGYAVVAKTNPHEAVDLFRRQADQFNLVVTDQTMPTMNGEEFVRALQEIRKDIPIILCTGFSHIMTAEKAAQLGLTAFLMKPVSAAGLAHTVKDVLGETRHPSNEI
jgi:PAS domain S-box-containing protein